MKIIDSTPQSITVSTEGELWQKIFLWVLGTISLFYFFLGNNNIELWGILGGLLASSIFFFLAELAFVTNFDAKNNIVVRKITLKGMILKKTKAPIDTSKLFIKYESARYGGGYPCIYLVLSSGKKFRIGCFTSIEKARRLILKIEKVAPIRATNYI